jgi:hypothetical protein
MVAHTPNGGQMNSERALSGNGKEPWHGTWGGYAYHRCRCLACRLANRLKCAAGRKRKMDRRHGAVKHIVKNGKRVAEGQPRVETPAEVFTDWE